MNIFVLDYDIEKAAQYHCDKHVVKMITEYAQIMCTVLQQNNIHAEYFYKPTHINHPCTIWAGKTRSNYVWLNKLAKELYKEYKYRYGGKTHKAGEVVLQLPIPKIPVVGLTPFAQVIPEQHRRKDVVEAYRTYYIEEKMNFVSYKNRKTPYWLTNIERN
jgi:hypothetical protein